MQPIDCKKLVVFVMVSPAQLCVVTASFTQALLQKAISLADIFTHAILREQHVLCNGERWDPPPPGFGLEGNPPPSFGVRKFSVLRDPPPLVVAQVV